MVLFKGPQMEALGEEEGLFLVPLSLCVSHSGRIR